MLYREIIAVCSEIHTKHINTLCGQNVELFNVKLAVKVKVNQSHYRPEVPRGFQEVKVPRLRDNGPEWW